MSQPAKATPSGSASAKLQLQAALHLRRIRVGRVTRGETLGKIVPNELSCVIEIESVLPEWVDFSEPLIFDDESKGIYGFLELPNECIAFMTNGNALRLSTYPFNQKGRIDDETAVLPFKDDIAVVIPNRAANPYANSTILNNPSSCHGYTLYIFHSSTSRS